MPTRTQSKHARKNLETCCRVCGEIDSDFLTIDHIAPLAHDGQRNDSANFQKLCVACNRMKDTFEIWFPLRDHSEGQILCAKSFILYKQNERSILKARIETLRQKDILELRIRCKGMPREEIKEEIKRTKRRIKIDEVV